MYISMYIYHLYMYIICSNGLLGHKPVSPKAYMILYNTKYIKHIYNTI